MKLKRDERNVNDLVEGLDFSEKVDRALNFIDEARRQFGAGLVVANSLGKDSAVVWDLAKRVSKDIEGFVVLTRYMPPQTMQFMEELNEQFPELKVYRNDEDIPDELYETDPDECCKLLKVKPTRWALNDLGARCWITGLRYTEGRTRTDFEEVEQRDEDLIKLNPILSWQEREIWQYLAVRQVPVNPLYEEGYRSLGCAPCTEVVSGSDERAGRWAGTSKQGGECGIHTCPMRPKKQQMETSTD